MAKKAWINWVVRRAETMEQLGDMYIKFPKDEPTKLLRYMILDKVRSLFAATCVVQPLFMFEI